MGLLTKAEFVTAINKMQEVCRFYDDINTTCVKYHAGEFIPPDCLGQMAEVLSRMFDDKGEWVDYFCFEIDFGNDWKPGMITDGDGGDIKLLTPEDLYNLLLQNMKGTENGNDS